MLSWCRHLCRDVMTFTPAESTLDPPMLRQLGETVKDHFFLAVYGYPRP
ncbi:hypothetical protein CGRA01v4_11225 [Colletotrichum graminicola]|nr:hypothetical protein CGRA01v4_11225 [Colletotrichum graminicola]